MSVVSGIVLFVIIWWVVLFGVLPFGTEPDPNPEVGMAGQPRNPQIMRKAVITSLVTAILWLGLYFLIRSDLISFREMFD